MLVLKVRVIVFVVVPATEPATVIVVQLVAVTDTGFTTVIVVVDVSEPTTVEELDSATVVLLEVASITVMLAVEDTVVVPLTCAT